MKKQHAEKLEEMSADCDRAVVRLTLKGPGMLNSDDVVFVTKALANARDGLQWAAKQGTRKRTKTE